MMESSVNPQSHGIVTDVSPDVIFKGSPYHTRLRIEITENRGRIMENVKM